MNKMERNIFIMGKLNEMGYVLKNPKNCKVFNSHYFHTDDGLDDIIFNGVNGKFSVFYRGTNHCRTIIDGIEYINNNLLNILRRNKIKKIKTRNGL